MVPKKVLMTDEIVLALIRSIGVNTSLSRTFIRSRIVRDIRAKSHTELVIELFTDRTHTTIAQVVDIVDVGLGVDQLDKVLNNSNDIFFGQVPLYREIW